MRTAVFALTAAGARLAGRISGRWQEAEVFLPEGPEIDAPAGSHIHRFEKLGAALRENFGRYDVLICVMATGIVVRMLAPLLRSKLTDPAVLVCDEKGSFVISLLSGHVGGANACARRLAEAIGARPVITTATDVEGKLAPDALAERLALRPWPHGRIKELNAALLGGADIAYSISSKLPCRNFYLRELSRYGVTAAEHEAESGEGCRVIICPEEELPAEGLVPAGTLYLLPRRLIAGVGCRKGAAKQEILDALGKACSRIGRDVSFIGAMASVTLKAHERGLLEAAEEIKADIAFYEPETLQKVVEDYHLQQSEMVLKVAGVGNVCEAAALMDASKHGSGVRFALPKTKYKKVTVALVWQK